MTTHIRNTRKFPAFFGGLVVPREAPFAFLRVGSPAWLDRVTLKTGTMDDPVSVAGIAGYLNPLFADEDNARSLATLAIAAIEGAVIIALATRSTGALDDVGRHLIEIINLHRPAPKTTRI